NWLFQYYPAEGEAGGTQVVLEQPVVARRRRVADGPDRHQVRDAHRQRLVRETAVEDGRAIVPAALESGVRLPQRRFVQPPQELVHRAHHVGWELKVPRAKQMSHGRSSRKRFIRSRLPQATPIGRPPPTVLP